MQKSDKKQYCYFQIKPFKDNEREISYWEKILENLISLKEKKISFAVSGNCQDIKFFVKLPSDFKNFFSNTFYSSYSTSDLIELSTLKFSKEKKWIVLGKDSGFKSKTNFEKEGNYIDPMIDLLSLFQNIDRQSKLDLFFDYKFKLDEGAFMKMVHLFQSFFRWIWTPKNKETLEMKEEKKQEIYFAFSYAISTEDPIMKEAIERNLASVLVTFIQDGKFKLKTTPQWTFCSYLEAVNFFHIPTKNYFIKGLDYTLYRKLPYPSNLPEKTETEFPEKLTVL